MIVTMEIKEEKKRVIIQTFISQTTSNENNILGILSLNNINNNNNNSFIWMFPQKVHLH